MKKMLFYFGAGALGALVAAAAAYLAGDSGLTRALGISVPTAVSAHRLYPLIVWGGIWGLLFLLPVVNSKPFLKGTLISLFPTIIRLFVIYPFQAKKGIAGIYMGMLTPAFVFAVNWVWGVATSLAIRYSR